jgi:hypothetical protein
VKRMTLAIFAAVTASAAAAAAHPEPREGSSAKDRLENVIQQAIHGEGPLLLAAERALVERKCGYAAGSWDGNSVSMTDGVLICSNGRRVDDPEVRAAMEVAGRRISARVNAAMARAEVRAAISAVADQASREAIERVRRERRRD